jgi:NAD(P)H-dependent FMN reductase
VKYAVILGSTRPGRAGEAVAEWVHKLASQRAVDYELVDLAHYDLDLLGEATVPGAANRQYESEKTRTWGAKIDEFDGYVFVTPEYNHGVPAALKNAFDVLYPEWGHKAVGFVAYGADGGVRAVEQWRQIVANAQMHAVRAQLSLQLFGGDFTDGQFTPAERRDEELATLLDQLEAWGAAARTLRD